MTLLRFLAILTTAVLGVFGQTKDTFPRTVASYTVATLPTPAANSIAIVTDGASASDCTTGGGSSRVLCVYSGSAWAALGGGGGGATTVAGLTDLRVTATTTVATISAGTARFGATPYPITAATATITGGSGSGTAKVFVTSAGAVVVEHPTAAGITISCSGCTASQVTTPTVPATAIPLADVAISSGQWSTITDVRALSSSKPLVAGTGIIISESLGEATIGIDTAEVARTSGTNVLTGTYDIGGGVLEVPNGTSLPGTCSVGQVFMDTDATSGQRIYACESANTWVLQGGGGGSAVGYTLTAIAAVNSPADSTTYCFADWSNVAPTTNCGDVRLYVPKTGQIKAVYGHFYTGGASGTSEASEVYIRQNNTSDIVTVTTTLTTNSINNPFNATGLSASVTAGDYINVKWVTPAWATNPTNMRNYVVIYIE